LTGPLLVGQLIVDAKLKKDEAQAVAMLVTLAEKGRPLISAAPAAGLTYDRAREFAQRFNIDFTRSGGPA
jgi:hypothetical protein